jgi:hypothetical protein
VTRYLTLAEYSWLAEQVTDTEATVLIQAARVELAVAAHDTYEAALAEWCRERVRFA